METTASVAIRDARPEDEAALVAIWNAYSTRTTLERARNGEVTYLVAESAGRTVAQLCMDWSAVPGTCYIYAISVAPEVQARGIGTRLLGEAEIRARAAGYTVLSLKVEHTNPRAQRLYERLGFSVSADGFDEWDERTPDGTVIRHIRVSTWLMRKPLV